VRVIENGKEGLARSALGAYIVETKAEGNEKEQRATPRRLSKSLVGGGRVQQRVKFFFS
jgi:hypothetical protein